MEAGLSRRLYADLWQHVTFCSFILWPVDDTISGAHMGSFQVGWTFFCIFPISAMCVCPWAHAFVWALPPALLCLFNFRAALPSAEFPNVFFPQLLLLYTLKHSCGSFTSHLPTLTCTFCSWDCRQNFEMRMVVVIINLNPTSYSKMKDCLVQDTASTNPASILTAFLGFTNSVSGTKHEPGTFLSHAHNIT